LLLCLQATKDPSVDGHELWVRTPAERKTLNLTKRFSMHHAKSLSTIRFVPAFAAVLLLVLSSASHIHLRYCLDGDEAPVSVHFESKETHSDDTGETGHDSNKADIETELSLEIVLAKLAKHTADSTAILPAEFSLTATSYSPAKVPPEQVVPPQQSSRSLPPSRAPPELV
jgi:hypothetical protein